MTIIRRQAKDTLTALELNHGDRCDFTCTGGETVTLEVIDSAAAITRTTLKQLRVEENAARTDYRFHCDLSVNGTVHRLEREVSTQQSFYEPWVIGGLRIWLDAVSAIFDFLVEEHGVCAPQKQVRLAAQQEDLRICPDRLHPWCPLPEGGLRIEDCYRGEDCWLGAYNGASAHGGLDLNHPRGTPLWTPLEIHDHCYFNSLAMGQNNNRWRGWHHWDNGATWILQAHHMTELTVPEHQPLQQGQQFAWGAGVLSGAVDHSHFVFKVEDEGETVLLDPWILFWQMYQDQGR